MVLQALGQDGLDAAGHLRDQRGVRGVRGGCLERVPDGDDPAVDELHQVDEQAQQAATATTTTRPRMFAIVQRLCSVEDIASVWCIANLPAGCGRAGGRR